MNAQVIIVELTCTMAKEEQKILTVNQFAQNIITTMEDFVRLEDAFVMALLMIQPVEIQNQQEFLESFKDDENVNGRKI